MEKYIKNNFNRILSIFILIQPIIDLFTGVFIHIFNINFTIGIVFRMLFLLFIIFSTMFVYHKKNNLIYYSIFLIYSVFYILGIILFKNSTGLFSEIQGLFRTYYFPLLLISLYSIRENISINIKVLVYTLLLYLLLIFIPGIFDIGFKTYEITKAGKLGFFNSANEVSGIISILTPIALFVFKERKNYLFMLLISVIYLIVIFNMGTKTPILSLIITLLFFVLWLWVKNVKLKNYKIIGISFISLLVLLISIISIIPKTNFYKNIETHLDFLEVDDITDVFEKPKLIDHFIFSQRLTFLSKRQKIYIKSNNYQKLFGFGYLKDDKSLKAIEMDYFDIYYNQGLVGFIVFFMGYVFVLYKVISNRKKLDLLQYTMFISLFLIIILSLFTGHIITSPSVSLFVSIIILIMLDDVKTCLNFNKVL